MKWHACLYAVASLFLVTAHSVGSVIVNNAQPITKRVTVQIIQTAANNGANAAPLFGTPSQQIAIFEELNQIWSQAGLEVKFNFRPGTWNWGFALLGRTGFNNPRPGTDLSTIVGDADQLGVLDPDPTVINLFLVRIVPGFSQSSDNTCNGQSLTSGNGVTLWVGPNTPISTAGRDLIAHILAHEIGHNLGLLHITASQNLLLASYSPGELLNPSQTITARSSSFAVAVAEAGTKPTVAVTSPQDQFVTLQSGVSVLGTALDARGISGVTVAGTPATSSDGFATWSAMLTGLTPGQNTLTVVATDKVTPGNTTSIPWHVFYATDTGDADSDGLPDDWEFTNGLDLFDNGSVSPSNGALGDPDHDGIANLPEYALNGNPHEPGSAILPVSAIEINPSDGNPYLTFTYHRRINPTGISYGVEVSGDVAAWISDPVNYEEIAPPVPDPNGITETVRLRIKPTVNQSGNPARFVRFRTTKSP